MADAIFTACFLSAMNRNCDIVGMANFAPILNTRGCIYSHPEGIVLRSTYHVFDLYVNYLGDTIIDLWTEGLPTMKVTHKSGKEMELDTLYILATKWSNKPGISLSVINKHPVENQTINLSFACTGKKVTLFGISGETPDSYNDVDKNEVVINTEELGDFVQDMSMEIKPHSVNIIQII